ncbi:hypothetical protein M9H77_27630 [Catharanthus roseus]|uniref:Uncharacterized protein n=1 Tax=Catharanthus roseus TaxID=4058 RepID=A0ACC0AEH6_CATRO|nr:hypothetical protein M9H77_27630 [Catharanthus roseus]
MELHNYEKGQKKGEYVDFRSARFWEKFHEVCRKAEEDAEASSTAMPDNLQLMAITAGGVSRGRLYSAGSEAFHFIAESSQAAAGLASCCLDHEQRLMQRVKDVPRVSTAFNEHMQRLFEHNHLEYIPFLPMMPLVRVAMSADTSTSTYCSSSGDLRGADLRF